MKQIDDYEYTSDSNFLPNLFLNITNGSISKIQSMNLQLSG